MGTSHKYATGTIMGWVWQVSWMERFMYSGVLLSTLLDTNLCLDPIEVYDPRENHWYPIMPITLGRLHHQVVVSGRKGAASVRRNVSVGAALCFISVSIPQCMSLWQLDRSEGF